MTHGSRFLGLPLGTVLILLLSGIWGSTWLVIKIGLADLPPFLGAGVRFVVAALGMTVLAVFLSGREGGRNPPVWLWLTVGSIQFAASYGLVYTAEVTLPSGMTALLWSSHPLILGAMAHFALPGDRLRKSQWLGLLLGFAGVALLFQSDLGNYAGRRETLIASGILLVSPVIVGISTVLVKRYGSDCKSLILTRNGMAAGAVLLLAVSWWKESHLPAAWTPVAVLSILYLAVFGTVVAFSLYFWLLRYERATRLSVIAYISPLIAVFLGAALLGEPVPAATIAGGAVVLTGVRLATGKSRR